MAKEIYTVDDIIGAGYNLEPLRCIHCGTVGEVTFLQYIGDGICGICGEWHFDEVAGSNDDPIINFAGSQDFT